jgi:hypothetical protein
VEVDEPGRDGHSAGVDLLVGNAAVELLVDRHDPTPVDPEVADARWTSGAVITDGVADDEIDHRVPAPLALANRLHDVSAGNEARRQPWVMVGSTGEWRS